MAENDTNFRWRTPDGIMRHIRRKGKTRRQSLSTVSLNSSQNGPSIERSLVGPAKVKSRNPFAMKRPASDSSDVLKRQVLSPDCKDFSQWDLYSNVKNSKQNRDSDAATSLPFVYLEEDSIQGMFTPSTNEVSVKTQGQNSLPFDWTLKRKARFLSLNSFAWCGRTKGAEDANAVTQATRCINIGIEPWHSFSEPSEDLQKSWRVELNKLLVYWQQPSIPWLNLFPRFGQSTKLHSGPAPAIPMSDDVTNAMHDCWAVSFRSVLQLTRERLCPFFYICAQQYTALFRACTVNGQTDITCTLTPTTIGLRQLLKSEGIVFFHPNSEKPEKHVDMETRDLTQDNCNPSEPTSDSETQADDSTWDLIHRSIKLNGPKEASKDNLHAETSTSDTIFVTGNTNIQLLSNYLVNSRNSVTKSGSQANIPPTILAPVSFEGATLKKLSVRSGIARSFAESTLNAPKVVQPNSNARQYSLDVFGPLMPHCISGIHRLLKDTQGSLGYKAALSASLYSVPFNTSASKDPEVFPPHVKTNFGLPHAVEESLQCSDTNPICLNQVVHANGLYTWNK